MDEAEFYKNLGKRIKFLRESAHLTQEKLAEKCGISLDYLGKIEVNINKPGLKTVLKLANALDVPIKELFDF
uniref:helix-turn-helix domain-containing protein n=1 Tax=Candidatus Scatousia sp. TaxID=3085663 RepID=UPI00402933FD